ncbi:MAG: isocitrate/isopropylmalate family dehydrogenase [Verrucomicrobiales bacterium]
MRKHFGLFANLRPAICYPALTHASPVKEERIAGGFDVLCVRELTGGLYFGSPKEIRQEDGEEVAIDTMVYRTSEIERIARVAFAAAGKRKGVVTSIDKANVLQNGILGAAPSKPWPKNSRPSNCSIFMWIMRPCS